MLACQDRRDLHSNDLFGRANQRAVGLIGRAQRGRTINIPTWFLSVFGENVTLY
jgi:hypothetical protein